MPLRSPVPALTSFPSSLDDLRRRVLRALPEGRTLPEREWHRRHRWILGLLWLHVPALLVYGLLRGYGVPHLAVDLLPIAALAGLASSSRLSRRGRSAVASIGVLTCSAILIHLSGGLIEAHFHFFVMIAALTLYEDWVPFGIAMAYVALHHGVMGVLDPTAVYNHADARRDPWLWAGIHAGFVAAAGAASVLAWRLNEEVRAVARRNEERFRVTFEHAPIGVVLLDAAGRVVDANPAFSRIAERPLDALRGRTLSLLVGVEIPVAAATAREVRIERPGGGEAWIEITGAELPHGDDAPGVVLLQVQDVTERRRQRERLAAQAAELERRATDLERSNNDLEQFAYVASHDLSEPLRTVAGFVGLLRRRYGGRLDEDADMFIDLAVEGTERMRGLIDDLLQYSRAGRTTEDLEAVPLQRVVEQALVLLDGAVQEAGAEVAVAPALPAVRGDAHQLVQVMQNLLTNAIKFARPDAPPHVRVTAREEGPDAVLVVEDDGIGIEPKHVDRIFQMFQRLHGREAYPGSGIGLAIVKKIVERHDGRIWHEPSPSGGSRFCVRLPLATPAGHPARALTEATEDRETSAEPPLASPA